jgi:hypothetical protein
MKLLIMQNHYPYDPKIRKLDDCARTILLSDFLTTVSEKKKWRKLCLRICSARQPARGQHFA